MVDANHQQSKPFFKAGDTVNRDTEVRDFSIGQGILLKILFLYLPGEYLVVRGNQAEGAVLQPFPHGNPVLFAAQRRAHQVVDAIFAFIFFIR